MKNCSCIQEPWALKSFLCSAISPTRSFLSRLATEEEVQEGHMLAFPIPKSDAGRDINLVYNKNTPMTANVERFIKIIKDIYNI